MEHGRTVRDNPAAEPSMAALSRGATLLVWGMRQWLVAVRQRHCIKRALLIPHYRLQCVSAIHHLDALMRRLIQGAERKTQVRCPEHGHLSDDEQQLLLLVRIAQQGMPLAARRQAGNLVRTDCAAGLAAAAAGYGRQLQQAGLSVSSPPQLTLIRGTAS